MMVYTVIAIGFDADIYIGMGTPVVVVVVVIFFFEPPIYPTFTAMEMHASECTHAAVRELWFWM